MAEILSFPGLKGGFAIGLSWQHEEEQPSKSILRARALELGRNMRWGVVHKSAEGAVQSGFCEAIAGTKPAGLKPLAAIVAGQHRQPWMGLFHLHGSQYWYIAVRQGHAVIAGGDRVGSLEELAALRERHRALGEWTEVEGTLRDLANMARASKGVSVLRDVLSGPWKSAAYPVAAVAGVAALLAGGWYWYDQKQEAEREAQLMRQRAIAAAQRANEAARQQALPWVDEATPTAFLQACRRSWNRQALADAGWTLATWRCRSATPTTLTIETNWKRDGGVAANAPGVLSADGNQATATANVPAAFLPSSRAVSVTADAQRSMWTYAQGNGVGLQLTMPPALLPADGKTPVDPWLAMTADIGFGAPPWLGAGEGLDGVVGLRLTGVSYEAAAQAWKGTGKLYAMRDGASLPARNQ
ncbi:putative component of type II secretion apparatus [Cupriavidus necator]|uniref:Putative component of type II secretion apparatus n=1 Tax=Cupriavidus necator TaxID=106590 RepID=A0A1K0JH16_CUPNE|nr:putative component of type II secretion apparatus [Cupriavidus necator]